MPQSADQILTAAQMREAEESLIAKGTNVDELMQRAGRGAAEYVWRLAAHGRVIEPQSLRQQPRDLTVRFCFAKRDDTLKAALERLATL